MNRLNASWHFTVGSRNNERPELSRLIPTKTSIDSPSYFSREWDTPSYDDCYRLLTFSGNPPLDESWLNEKLRQMLEMWNGLVSKWPALETRPPTVAASLSSLSTTERNTIREDTFLSTNPGATLTSIMCSSPLAAGLGLPTANKVNLPTGLIASISGAKNPTTDSSIPKCKQGWCYNPSLAGTECADCFCSRYNVVS